jgi:hypothetical protein
MDAMIEFVDFIDRASFEDLPPRTADIRRGSHGRKEDLREV